MRKLLNLKTNTPLFSIINILVLSILVTGLSVATVKIIATRELENILGTKTTSTPSSPYNPFSLENITDIKLEYVDNKLSISAETWEGGKIQLSEDALDEISERLSNNHLRLGISDRDVFAIQKNDTIATTRLPISIDLKKNTLSLYTKDGSKKLAVFPDEAVLSLIERAVISRVDSKPISVEFKNTDISNIELFIFLDDQDGRLVYAINGVADKKVAGFIPIAIDKVIFLSAEDGKILTVDQSILNRILDIISI